MAACEIDAGLRRLLELIMQERAAARGLDMRTLEAVASEKQALIELLQGLDAEALETDEDLSALARQVREENRRNAYLFWTGLNLVRDTMAFFERQVPPPGYGAAGLMTQSRPGGRLLSGRI
ncbi:flagellar protein FlgN [Geoalkalibacter halelectricus]|uniref:Flagellar protein FlgN n=1 Tax=Geoalkalibacter halelectricus TaxID=2847045 RepID=A0ABY5ZGP6_9BACT|nr:flagellar protein FlgN [Geoalkalibacter halelectricus]MDO3378048.1 flagellar protein FlgN [Geoalkalibacter halelectricus]UWZ78347.1 flagellar protein FlgN [Geoalkalibacter halelectricus]